MKQRGYTLTELVVVCSILVVLAAVMTPVIMRAKEAAKESVCASNLHQLWVATALYRERYDGGPAY